MLNPAPFICLRNGINIANFSSPHPFTFEDGLVLDACDEERCRALSLKVDETETKHPLGWTDLDITFHTTDVVREELFELEEDPNVDVVLVPFPVLEAVKREGHVFTKMRCIRVKDRVKKTIYTDRFCT